MRSGFNHYSNNDHKLISEVINDEYRAGYQILIIDIDDTLRNTDQRACLLPSPEKVEYFGDEPNLAFKLFNMSGEKDEPLMRNIDIVNSLLSTGTYFPIFLTSCTRYDCSMKACRKLIDKHIQATNYSLIMRDPDNHLHPKEYKEDFCHRFLPDKYKEAVTFIDDNPEICELLTDLGYYCLQVFKRNA